jgi:hypothetical protein
MAISACVSMGSSPWSWLGVATRVLADRSGPRWLSWAAAAVALTCAGALPAVAQSPPQVLFQSVYERGGDKTDTYQGAFSTCDPTGSYRLVFDNGIDGTKRVSGGSVLVNGVKVLDVEKKAAQIVRSVTLLPANGIEVQLSGGPHGGRVRVTVDGSPRCLGVRFTAPLAGSVIAQPDTLVEGEIDAPGAAAVGVQLRVSYSEPAEAPVEMFVASQTSGRRFAAWLPLAPGTVKVTALATDAAGGSGEGSISFTFSPASPDDTRATHPGVSPTSGFAPLTVTFDCGAAADPEADVVDLDVDGDGVTDFTRDDCAVPPHQVTHTYFTEGLYVTTLLTRDVAGRTHLQRVPINVVPPPDLTALWAGFRSALGSGDIDAALRYVAFEAQARYRRAFQDLQPDLATIAAGLQGLTPLVVTSEYATAATTRVLAGVSELFIVSFIRDGDGMWRIASF